MFCVYRCLNVVKWPDRIMMHNVNVYHIYLISIYLSTHLSIYLSIYLYIKHIHVYICIYTRFQKGCNLKKLWNIYTFCLISHIKRLLSLWWENKRYVYILCIFSNCNVFESIYIYMYVCLYFLVSSVLTLSFTKYSHNLISASYRSHKQCVKDQNNTNERTL